jgi:hypothetical protein
VKCEADVARGTEKDADGDAGAARGVGEVSEPRVARRQSLKYLQQKRCRVD